MDAASKKEVTAKSGGSATAQKRDEEYTGNWRKGNFAESLKTTKETNDGGGMNSGRNSGRNSARGKKKNNNQVDQVPLMVEPGMQQRPKTTCVNAHLLMVEDPKKMSKHAKRRANKKAKQAAAAAEEGNQAGPDQTTYDHQ